MSSSPDVASTAKGRLVVVSGSSGAGKTSICDALLERLPDAVWSVSATTRRIRGSEVGGKSYEFVSVEEFKRREQAGELLESAEYCGHWYGTPKGPVEEAIRCGRFIIMEIDVQGGAQVAAQVPDSTRIFLMPPNADELRARLEGRKTEGREQLEERMAQVERENTFARKSGAYGHFVVNDDLETAIDEVEAIILKESKRG